MSDLIATLHLHAGVAHASLVTPREIFWPSLLTSQLSQAWAIYWPPILATLLALVILVILRSLFLSCLRRARWFLRRTGR